VVVTIILLAHYAASTTDNVSGIALSALTLDVEHTVVWSNEFQVASSLMSQDVIVITFSAPIEFVMSLAVLINSVSLLLRALTVVQNPSSLASVAFVSCCILPP
jgi:hypothetical protein